jgi:hypothetical protein
LQTERVYYSRYLLGCQALNSTAVAEAKPVFTRLFKEYELPKRIRTDNGVPFATNTLARLSSLSAWWVRLGHPARVHRTRQTAAERPPRIPMLSATAAASSPSHSLFMISATPRHSCFRPTAFSFSRDELRLPSNI